MKNILKVLLAVFATFLPTNKILADDGQLDSLRGAVASENWAEAKTLGETATAADAENGEAFYLLGKALVGLKEYEAAVSALKSANKLVKGNADYLTDYGYALVMRGQEMNMFQAGPVYMRAMDQYKEAIKVNPDQLAAHIGLARYYWNAPAIGGGSMKKAHEHVLEVARINPYLGHIESAALAEKENRLADAEADYAAAIAMKGGQAWLYFELGKLQQMSGKMLEAKASYEMTLELEPGHEGAKAALTAFGG